MRIFPLLARAIALLGLGMGGLFPLTLSITHASFRPLVPARALADDAAIGSFPSQSPWLDLPASLFGALGSLAAPRSTPARFDIGRRVDPLTSGLTPLSSAAWCDGDGLAGFRVQVLYLHSAGSPSHYADYLASFQQWAAEADSQFDRSAAQTGGARHIRFVHDAGCRPLVQDVSLSASAMQSFEATPAELKARGFDRQDRDYLLFADANVYCGVADFENDDRPGLTNRSNQGPHFARVDSGCWSGLIAAHELMHTFGAVQYSAPHSDGATHCRDGYDAMCDRGSSSALTFSACADASADALFDCGHDDYFHTNPPPGSYLATHWNTANNRFLIGAASR